MSIVRSYPLTIAPVQTITLPRDAIWLSVGWSDSELLLLHTWIDPIETTTIEHTIYMIETESILPYGVVSYIETVGLGNMNYHLFRGAT